MKRIISLFIMIVLAVSFAACGKETKNEKDNSTSLQNITNNILTSEKSTLETDNIGGNDVMSCNHIWEYHGIDSYYINYVEERAPGWTDKFSDMFIQTEDFNLRVFADYFGISKDALSKIISQEIIDFKIAEGVYSKADDIDLWYIDNYSTNSNFLVDDNPAPDSGSVMIRPENDTIHTDRYFTIHKSLINLVGELHPLITWVMFSHFLRRVLRSASSSATFFPSATVRMMTPKLLGLILWIRSFNLLRSSLLLIFCETDTLFENGTKTI